MTLSIYETDKRRYAEEMLPHYLECAAWADAPEDTPPLDFAPSAEEGALADCMRFTGINWERIKDVDPAQVGHDLWLTRNHHGAGFWDRPEVYGGEDNAEALAASAHSFGSKDVFVYQNQLIIE